MRLQSKILWVTAEFAFVALLAVGRGDAATVISACGTVITTPGAYVLSGNLVNSTNGACIAVTTSRVTIDLAGYSITSANGCCKGINGTYNFLSVSNGTIQGFTIGIQAQSDLNLDRINLIGNSAQGANWYEEGNVSNSQFRNNGDIGLQVQRKVVIRDSVFAYNGSDGLNAQVASISHSSFISNKRNGLSSLYVSVIGCVAAYNKGDGFGAGLGSTLEDNVARGNGGYGFFIYYSALTGTTLRGNISSENGKFGFGAPGSTLLGNTANSNGLGGFDDLGVGGTYEANTALGNAGDGFHGAASSSSYTNNTSDNNTGWGFNLVCPDNLIGNLAQQNTLGQFTSTGSPDCNKVTNLGF